LSKGCSPLGTLARPQSTSSSDLGVATDFFHKIIPWKHPAITSPKGREFLPTKEIFTEKNRKRGVDAGSNPRSD